ncbi:hypothetical protein C1Y11_13255 [Pseudomonas sp. FW305-20]|nr:hypothetical protein C1Y11_13255 [Pseudomonas sp. FW305-20]PMU15593.1 hypothetical protein C1Y10_21895 [Pseudomonas sp. FW305-122]PMU37433.1 hypothetical protein C1Y12_19310 [Pseudomonas sp. FW305-47B]PMX60140.1 hypothetical protein C1Y13_15390 [Pseudomonas sp. FW305-33]PMX63600.1 hypothetical protein C1X12_22355 [Pseudomonas sp. FW305-60]
MNSADRQSMGRAKSRFWMPQAAVLLDSFGLTGLNSLAAFRTPIAHCRISPNPHGARLAGRRE